MNTNTIRKFATSTLAAALIAGPALVLAPAAGATTVDPTPAGDSLGVIVTDGEQNIVAITTEIDPGSIQIGPDGVVGQVAQPCADLDPSVRVPIADQPNFCYLDRSGLARGADDLGFPTANVDPSLGITPISAPINLANPASDAANAGKWLSIALSALAVGGTAVSLTRHRKEVTNN